MTLPNGKSVTKSAPTAVVVICATVVILAMLGSVVALSIFGKDAENLFRMLNILLNTLGVLTGTGALLYAGSAARSSARTEQNTNGIMDQRMQAASKEAMQDYGATSVKGGNPHGRPTL